MPKYIAFEVLTMVVMESCIFWDITLFCPWKKSPDILEETVAFIFRVKNKPSKKPV
jgi:hypothetical protein